MSEESAIYGDTNIIRVRKDARYFVASNVPFNDARLTWEARGVMGYILSKPDNWIVRMSDLIKQGPASIRVIKRIMAELKQYGYITREIYKSADGKFHWNTTIYETPELNTTIGTDRIDGTIGTICIDGKRTHIVSTELPSTDIKKEYIEKTEKPNFSQMSSIKDYLSVPEIDLFRECTGWIPGSFVMETVYEFMSAGINPDKLRAAFREWTARGYKPGNVQGYLTWARDGIPPAGPKFKTSQARKQDTSDFMAGLQRAIDNNPGM